MTSPTGKALQLWKPIEQGGSAAAKAKGKGLFGRIADKIPQGLKNYFGNPELPISPEIGAHPVFKGQNQTIYGMRGGAGSRELLGKVEDAVLQRLRNSNEAVGMQSGGFFSGGKVNVVPKHELFQEMIGQNKMPDTPSLSDIVSGMFGGNERAEHARGIYLTELSKGLEEVQKHMGKKPIVGPKGTGFQDPTGVVDRILKSNLSRKELAELHPDRLAFNTSYNAAEKAAIAEAVSRKIINLSKRGAGAAPGETADPFASAAQWLGGQKMSRDRQKAYDRISKMGPEWRMNSANRQRYKTSDREALENQIRGVEEKIKASEGARSKSSDRRMDLLRSGDIRSLLSDAMNEADSSLAHKEELDSLKKRLAGLGTSGDQYSDEIFNRLVDQEEGKVRRGRYMRNAGIGALGLGVPAAGAYYGLSDGHEKRSHVEDVSLLSMMKVAARDDEEEIYKSPFSRFMQVGTGLGMLKGNAPTALALAKGREDLWHGTPIENMFEGEHGPGILNTGLSTEFAGKNKRLNNVLMSNSLFRDTEEFLKNKGVKITPEIEDRLYHLTDDFLKRQKDSGRPIHQALGEEAANVAKEFGVDAGELAGHYQKRLPDLGKRIYFGTKPEAVSFWSREGKNELDYAMEKAKQEAAHSNLTPGSAAHQAKIWGEGMAEQATGGYFNELRAKSRYGKPGSINDVEGLDGLRAALDPWRKKGVDLVFRSSVPTQTLDHMKDVPVFRHLFASSPGVKSIVSRFFPQNDPSKDLSIAENLDPRHINMADIVDRTTGRVLHRINVKGAQKAPFKFLGGAGHRMSSLKKGALPGLLTLGGASMIYSGLKPNGGWGGNEKTGAEKTAGVNRGTMMKAFAYPAAAFGLAGGSAIAARHALGVDLPPAPTAKEMENMPFKKKLRISAKESEFSKKLAPLAALGGVAAGGTLGALAAPKGMRLPASLLGSYMMGNVAASYAPFLAQYNTLIRADPEGSGLLGMAVGKTRGGRDLMRAHPEESAVTDQALTAGLMGALPYYTAKRYYPYHAQKGINMMKGFAEPLLKGLKNPEIQSKMKKLYAPAVLASVGIPVGLSMLKDQAVQSALESASN